MISLKVLSLPITRLSSDLHPFYKWKKQFKDHGIDLELVFSHESRKLRNADRVLLYHRYFDHGMKNALNEVTQNDSRLINYLKELRQHTGKIIWFDLDDSSGSKQFPVIPYVDSFVKKQVLKDREYYTETNPNRNLSVWMDPEMEQKTFYPCPSDQLHKIKIGWNIAYFDHRDFKLQTLLSNYMSYKIVPLKYTSVNTIRNLDLTFRGTVNYANNTAKAFQRNTLLNMLGSLNLKIASGQPVPRKQYLRELRQSKISISPFGLGEICYRDFETFITGSLLLKPSVEHLETFPNLFVPNETYIPVSWDLSNFKEKAEEVVNNYDRYKEIAITGQERYKSIINDSELFINTVKRIIE